MHSFSETEAHFTLTSTGVKIVYYTFL